MSDQERPGQWFSALEQRIWDVLGSVGPLYAKQIAKRLCRSSDTELSYALATMVARGVLSHKRGEGYRRAE